MGFNVYIVTLDAMRRRGQCLTAEDMAGRGFDAWVCISTVHSRKPTLALRSAETGGLVYVSGSRHVFDRYSAEQEA